MGRWRPPTKPGSFYITPSGYKRMTDEVKSLWPERDKVTKEVKAAAALGDRSENAEYIYGKKRLREIDGRLRHLGRRLGKLQVVWDTPKQTDKVFFGAWVTLLDEKDRRVKYRLVGPDEFDMHPDYISIDSPVARALLKKELDDEVEINTPSGNVFYEITHIEYEKNITFFDLDEEKFMLNQINADFENQQDTDKL